MRVLVAGAGGVTGRPLVMLSAAGHEVGVLTRSASGQEQPARPGRSR